MELEQTFKRLQQWTTARAEQWQVLRFWRWWKGELSPLVPARVRDWYLQRKLLMAVQLSDTECTIHAQAAGGWSERARLDFSGVDSAEQAIRISAELARVQDRRSRQPRVALLLAADRCLRRVLELPQAVEEDLRAAITFEMDRYTPFRAEQVYFDCSVTSRDYANNRIHVLLTVAPRQVVDAPRALLQSAGAQVIAVWPSLRDAGTVDLLPAASRPAGGIDVEWRTFAPAALLVVLFGLAVVLPIWHKREQVLALKPVVDRARAQADIADGMRRKLNLMVADYNFPLVKKRMNPTTVEILDEVTRLLPDDTWVQHLDLKTDPKSPDKVRELQIQGETGSSNKMIETVENSRYLHQASWKSPVTTAGAPGAGERYHLAALVRIFPADSKPRVPPPPIQAPVTSAEPAAAKPAFIPPQAAAAPPVQSPPSRVPLPNGTLPTPPPTSAVKSPGAPQEGVKH